ncbi:DMT family transporter [Nocardioides sp. WV_118_6]
MLGESSARTTGYAALAMTVVLWSSFALTSRGIGTSSLTDADAALIRFVVPLVLLAPLVPRTVRALARERTTTVLLLLAGGLPHYLVMAFGAGLTNAGLTGLLVPGTVPLFVTLLLLRRQRVPARAVAALATIVAGVVASATLVGTDGGTTGIVLLVGAGAIWACYTLGLQRTGLAPLEIVVAVCALSALGGLVLTLSGLLPSHLLSSPGTVRVGDVLTFAVLQGIGTGLLSTLCYAHAVRALGSSVAAVGGALSPVLTAVAAVPLFGETIGGGLGVALALVVTGVHVFNRTPPVPRTTRAAWPTARGPRPGPAAPMRAAEVRL